MRVAEIEALPMSFKPKFSAVENTKEILELLVSSSYCVTGEAAVETQFVVT